MKRSIAALLAVILSACGPGGGGGGGCPGGLNGDGSAAYEGMCEEALQYEYDAQRAAEALDAMEEYEIEQFERDLQEFKDSYDELRHDDSWRDF